MNTPPLSSPMDEPDSDDLRELDGVREQWAQAEASGATPFFESILADDAVIMAPGRPAFEGKGACMAFIRDSLADVNAEFDRRIVLTSAEVRVHGAWAFDRGFFWQHLIRREGGEELHESGKYFWLYRREAGAWKLARVVGNYDWEGDEDGEGGGDGEADTLNTALEEGSSDPVQDSDSEA